MDEAASGRVGATIALRTRAGACRGRLADEAGQVMLVTAVFLIGLLALVVLLTDVGAWFGNDRILQRGADAAALAGARVLALTGDQTAAGNTATANAGTNGITLDGSSRYSTCGGSVCVTASAVQVNVKKLKGQLPQTFVANANQNDRLATATATLFGVTQAAAVIPLAVYIGDVSIGSSAQLTFDKNAPDVGPGNFGAVDTCNAGSPGHVDNCVPSSTCFATKTCPTTVLGDYGAPGAGNMKKVVDKVAANWLNQDILLPVYDSGSGKGSNFQYHIVGFAGFHLTNATAGGNSGEIDGTFIRMIPVGGVGQPGQPNYGASAIYLTR